MPLKIKSYRGFILKLAIPFLVICAALLVSCSIYFVLYPEDIKDMELLIPYIVIVVLAIALFCVIMVARFYNGANYVFETNAINVYKGKKFIEIIDIENVEFIYYHPFRLRYIVTTFSGELMDGGVWKLHIKFKDGTKKSLSFFSLKNVKQIKEIYGDLIEIK